MHKPEDLEYCLKVAIGIITSPIPPRHISKPISLANYDVGFVNNAVRSINKNEGLSDRQRELTIKLVSKYTRQFKRLGIDVSDIVQNPVFSSPLRQVDRTRFIDIVDDKITIKFPYNKEMIREFTALSKKLRSIKTIFNKEDKRYTTDYNEYNLMAIFNWSAKHKFDYADKFMDIQKKCKNILHSRENYAIQLVVNNDNCILNNAPISLQDWWSDNMNKKDRMFQIVTAANQNIDIVNKSTDLKLSDVGTQILQSRGGKFDWVNTTPEEIYNSAVNEFNFKRIAFVIDGRTITEDLAQKLQNMVSKLGKDVCTVQLKNNKHLFKANKSLTSNTKFAIIDSVQRYSNPRVNHDWRPDFIISTNTISKYRQYGFNIVGGQSGVQFHSEAWICYYTYGQDLGNNSAKGKIIN